MIKEYAYYGIKETNEALKELGLEMVRTRDEHWWIPLKAGDDTFDAVLGVSFYNCVLLGTSSSGIHLTNDPTTFRVRQIVNCIVLHCPRLVTAGTFESFRPMGIWNSFVLFSDGIVMQDQMMRTIFYGGHLQNNTNTIVGCVQHITIVVIKTWTKP